MFMGGSELQDWARSASPGASKSLGVASAVPSTTAPIVRSLVDAEVIDIVRKRVGPELYRFDVQRRATRFVDRPVVRARGGNHARRAGTAERRILRVMLTAAERDLPCPTNEALARTAGLSGAIAASYRVRRLQERGLIRVHVPNDPRDLRVVTIVASGKKTREGRR